MSERVAKVESLIHHKVASELAQALGGASALVTVTGVDATPDLRHAIVWVGILGDKVNATFDSILELRADLQRSVARAMTTKFTPRLELKLDTSGRYAQEIEDLLKKL